MAVATVAGWKHRTQGDAMYRIDAWSQGDGAMWAPGSNGGAGVRTEDAVREPGNDRTEDEGDGEAVSQQEGEASLFEFDESDLDGVASY
ncbi:MULTISPECIES: hypothetical protein [Corallococcus]|uniref:hypothetical protein n=1 Tax=Corallococcus TaxID=83461 RepID=UPI00117EB550|nr:MULTISPECIES: hypothetical protein [Corallococcus]NBD13245.1 hypothetical protein [Corallococcus silvisoli]TSC23377.1 hypothetical protein FOF48_30210 [Corallococcus sp. Z5C101001]